MLFGASVATFDYSAMSSILSAITNEISVTTIIAILAGVAGAAIGLVFMWWGVRKLVRTLMSAFRKGKLSI